MSYKAEVIADSSGEWVGNSVRFATRDEAEAYANDLMSRWLSVRESRVVTSPDPVNYEWKNGYATPLPISPEEKLLNAIHASGTSRLTVGRN